MHNTILPALLFSLLTFALSCDSCDEDDGNDLPAFTGITMTDENGLPLNAPDTTDWRVGDAWEQVENGLFDLAELPLCSGNAEASPGFPNPCGNAMHFRFVSPANAAGYFRVVDKDFNVLVEADSIPFEAGAKTISLNFSAVSPGTVRLYYRLVSGTCEYRGHGDILVQ